MLSLPAVPCTCSKQRFPAVASGQPRSVAVAPDPRQRRIAVNLTVLPKLAVPIAVRRAGLPGNATITTMDCDWMRERLEKFRAVCEECAHSESGRVRWRPRVQGACTAREAANGEPCFKALDLDLASFNLDTMAGEHEGITAADRGLGMLADLDDVAISTRPRRRPCRPTSFALVGLGCRRRTPDAGVTSPSSRRQEHHSPHPAEDRVPAGR